MPAVVEIEMKPQEAVVVKNYQITVTTLIIVQSTVKSRMLSKERSLVSDTEARIQLPSITMRRKKISMLKARSAKKKNKKMTCRMIHNSNN